MESFKLSKGNNSGGDSGWKSYSKRKKVLVIILIFIAVGIFGSLFSDDKTNSPAANPTVSSQASSATPSPTPAPAPQDSHPHFSDGTFKVGSDIQPGTYRTRKGSSGCYYERMKDFEGGIDSILDNDNTDAPAVVTILPTDAGFKSKDCGTWTQNLDAITSSQTSFSDGIYIVGTDFTPGTYKSSGQEGCYWERMADFTGGLHSILANENTDTPAIVTITAADKGFKAKDCGTWTKL